MAILEVSKSSLKLRVGVDSKRDRIYQELSEIQWQWKNIRATVECHLKDVNHRTSHISFLFYHMEHGNYRKTGVY